MALRPRIAPGLPFSSDMDLKTPFCVLNRQNCNLRLLFVIRGVDIMFALTMVKHPGEQPSPSEGTMSVIKFFS